MDRQPNPNKKNARLGERLPIQCTLVVSNGVQVGEGWVIDLSMRGCLVEGSVHVKAGDRLQLRLCLPLIRPFVCLWPSSSGLRAVGSASNYEGGRPVSRSPEPLYHLQSDPWARVHD